MSADFEKTTDVAIAFDVDLPIVVTKDREIASYVKGYHVHKRLWTPISNELLQTRGEPKNPTDKYVVCVLKDGKVAGHLKKGSNGRFAKTIFYFLRSDTYAKCCVKVQIKWFFFIAEFERATKISKIAVYRCLISLLVPEL